MYSFICLIYTSYYGLFISIYMCIYTLIYLLYIEFVFAQAAIVGGSIERNKLIEEIVG